MTDHKNQSRTYPVYVGGAANHPCPQPGCTLPGMVVDDEQTDFTGGIRTLASDTSVVCHCRIHGNFSVPAGDLQDVENNAQ